MVCGCVCIYICMYIHIYMYVYTYIGKSFIAGAILCLAAHVSRRQKLPAIYKRWVGVGQAPCEERRFQALADPSTKVLNMPNLAVNLGVWAMVVDSFHSLLAFSRPAPLLPNAARAAPDPERYLECLILKEKKTTRH